MCTNNINNGDDNVQQNEKKKRKTQKLNKNHERKWMISE